MSPPVGIEREISGQKAEEWVEQVLLGNIAPRIAVHIRRLPIPETERIVLVLYAPMSARAPHMVTFQGDNRYYRRFFKRHQFQSSPAEEYEVREMYERSLRLYDQVQRLLERKGYGDPESSTFGVNPWSKRLEMRYRPKDGQIEDRAATAWVAFFACPNVLTEDAIDTGSEMFWAWLEPNLRKYNPRPNAIFLPVHKKRLVLEGAICYNQSNDLIREYLLVSRNGFVEFGGGYATYREEDGKTYFPFVQMMGRFWQFTSFVVDLYQAFGLLGGFRLSLSMKNTQNSLLWNLAKGWSEPHEDFPVSYRPPCTEENIHIIRELPSPIMDDATIAQLVKDFATRVDNAYGNRVPRCYNLKRDDPKESFPVDKMW